MQIKVDDAIRFMLIQLSILLSARIRFYDLIATAYRVEIHELFVFKHDVFFLETNHDAFSFLMEDAMQSAQGLFIRKLNVFNKILDFYLFMFIL